eukprot:6001440-Pyramimonas_sp.AAC.1
MDRLQALVKKGGSAAGAPSSTGATAGSQPPLPPPAEGPPEEDVKEGIDELLHRLREHQTIVEVDAGAEPPRSAPAAATPAAGEAGAHASIAKYLKELER